MHDNNLAIDIRGVSKRYEEHVAVRDLSLQVPRGTVYGLLGPNGAGKTTTIRMLLDIIAPDTGSIAIFGQPHHQAAIRNRVGYLPEERGLYRKMQARHVFARPARHARGSRAAHRKSSIRKNERVRQAQSRAGPMVKVSRP